MSKAQQKWNKSYLCPVIGFFLSLLLVLVIYFIIIDKHLEPRQMQWAIAGFTAVEGLIQFVFFLHLGIESTPRWNLMMFFFMVVVAFIVIGGSLWIMDSINANMSTSY